MIKKGWKQKPKIHTIFLIYNHQSFHKFFKNELKSIREYDAGLVAIKRVYKKVEIMTLTMTQSPRGWLDDKSDEELEGIISDALESTTSVQASPVSSVAPQSTLLQTTNPLDENLTATPTITPSQETDHDMATSIGIDFQPSIINSFTETLDTAYHHYNQIMYNDKVGDSIDVENPRETFEQNLHRWTEAQIAITKLAAMQYKAHYDLQAYTKALHNQYPELTPLYSKSPKRRRKNKSKDSLIQANKTSTHQDGYKGCSNFQTFLKLVRLLNSNKTTKREYGNLIWNLNSNALNSFFTEKKISKETSKQMGKDNFEKYLIDVVAPAFQKDCAYIYNTVTSYNENISLDDNNKNVIYMWGLGLIANTWYGSTLPQYYLNLVWTKFRALVQMCLRNYDQLLQPIKDKQTDRSAIQKFLIETAAPALEEAVPILVPLCKAHDAEKNEYENELIVLDHRNQYDLSHN
jgi:hypothetical protein